MCIPLSVYHTVCLYPNSQSVCVSYSVCIELHVYPIPYLSHSLCVSLRVCISHHVTLVVELTEQVEVVFEGGP